MRSLVIVTILFCGGLALGRASETAATIQNVELSASRPYFIPTHPRVTTTVRFPNEIGAPDGAATVFTEDATNQTAEYAITWQRGDAYFTISPLRNPRLANLNVPYEGRTYVLYFYPVPDELNAVAAVNLVETGAPAGRARSETVGSAPSNATIARNASAPTDTHIDVTPARLLGLMDRLKVVHATAVGRDLAELVAAMGLEVAVTGEELAAAKPRLTGALAQNGVAAEIGTGLTDAGFYQLVLLRAVRDRRLNCVGFVCLLRNTSDQVLAFDVNSFGARAGTEYLGQRISDATPILKPGEQAPAYFVVQPNRNSPLLAANDWKLSVDLVSPRSNPGADVAKAFHPARP